jgi:hypothetical protein
MPCPGSSNTACYCVRVRGEPNVCMRHGRKQLPLDLVVRKETSIVGEYHPYSDGG